MTNDNNMNIEEAAKSLLLPRRDNDIIAEFELLISLMSAQML